MAGDGVYRSPFDPNLSQKNTPRQPRDPNGGSTSDYPYGWAGGGSNQNSSSNTTVNPDTGKLNSLYYTTKGALNAIEDEYFFNKDLYNRSLADTDAIADASIRNLNQEKNRTSRQARLDLIAATNGLLNSQQSGSVGSQSDLLRNLVNWQDSKNDVEILKDLLSGINSIEQNRFQQKEQANNDWDSFVAKERLKITDALLGYQSDLINQNGSSTESKTDYNDDGSDVVASQTTTTNATGYENKTGDLEALAKTFGYSLGEYGAPRLGSFSNRATLAQKSFMRSPVAIEQAVANTYGINLGRGYEDNTKVDTNKNRYGSVY